MSSEMTFLTVEVEHLDQQMYGHGFDSCRENSDFFLSRLCHYLKKHYSRNCFPFHETQNVQFFSLAR